MLLRSRRPLKPITALTFQDIANDQLAMRRFVVRQRMLKFDRNSTEYGRVYLMVNAKEALPVSFRRWVWC